MRFSWHEQAVTWFDEASAYTGFHRQLCDLLLPRMKKRDSLIDLGCGAGLIDFALAGHFGRITCLDRDALAVAAVNQRAQARGLNNVRAIQGDAYALSGQWDNVLMVFFGGLGQNAPRYLSLCREGVVAVVHGDQPEDEGRRPRGHNTISTTRAGLDALGIPYDLAAYAREYGQPFRTRAQARQYVEFYEKVPPGEDAETYLDRHLTPGRGEYGWYLPNLKQFGIFTLGRIEHESH